ncbi:MAG: aminotransferase class III-fold pyridoxal phosphate-dependent enzyme [Deltaproteobacteria bacterium]|nr:aminotransferase class III-fold pyridoxal phosphate-dependent enzyme [Deltaproteobacteria bacterium]
MEDYVQLDKQFVVETYYHTFESAVVDATDCWYILDNGQRILNFTSAYSAQNWGIKNQRFIDVLCEQARILPLTSRAICNNVLPVFAKELCQLLGYEQLIPMNSGAEAVETAIKVARRWGVEVKGVPENRGEIIVFSNNFAGRTITLISFYSEDPSLEARRNFGPFTAGFKICEFNSEKRFLEAVNQNTVAVLFEPIQGEGGINVIDQRFLQTMKKICNDNQILIIADEIQCGLYRAGDLLASYMFDLKPDLVILGKSLGGGLVPISVVVGCRSIFQPMKPGSHGSTFGGNPLAARVGLEVVRYLKSQGEELKNRVLRLGDKVKEFLRGLNSSLITDVKGTGLMLGLELDCDTEEFIKNAFQNGILLGKTRHSKTVRLTPPLVVSEADLEIGLAIIEKTLNQMKFS